jgi:polyisoprenoid-binding protein YceI
MSIGQTDANKATVKRFAVAENTHDPDLVSKAVDEIFDPDVGSSEAISGRWQLDPQRSSVEFRVGHFWGLVTMKGHFDDYQGQA